MQNDFIGFKGGEVRTQIVYPPVDEGGTFKDIKKYYVSIKTHKEILFHGNTIPNGWNEKTQGKIVLRSDSVRKNAENVYHKLNSTNLSGTIETFGLPYVKHGDIVELRDKYNDEVTDIDGKKFLVKGVKTSFGTSGLRQSIMLDYSYESLTEKEKEDLNNGKY